MTQERGKSEIKYPEGASGPDRMSHGSVTLVVNASGHRTPRSKDELREEIAERQVASAADVCRTFGVTVEGEYAGLDGEPRHASIPVQDETTFTPDGLTRGDPELFGWYVGTRTCEKLAEYLSEHDREVLTPEEIEHLTSTMEILRRSLEGGES